METSEETPNWIPAFPATSEAGDSASSFPSAPVDPQADDESFDAISRQKLKLVEQTIPPKSHPTPAPPISMFEEDTRSSWSVEPPKPPVEDCQNNLGSPLENTPIQPFKEALEEAFQEPEKKHLKIESLDCVTQEDKPSTPSFNETPPDEDSQISSSPKPPAGDLQTNGFITPQEEQSQPNDVFLNPQDEQSQPNDSFLNPPEEQSQLEDSFLNPLDDQSQPNDGFLNPLDEQSQPNDEFLNTHEDQSQPNDAFLNPQEEQSPPIDMFLDSREDQSQPGDLFLNPPEEKSQPTDMFLDSEPSKSNNFFNPQEEDSQLNDVFLTPQEEQSLDGATESRPTDIFVNPPEEQSLDDINPQEEQFLDGVNPQEEQSLDGVNPQEEQSLDGVNPQEEQSLDCVNPQEEQSLDGVNPQEEQSLDGVNRQEEQSLDFVNHQEEQSLDGGTESRPNNVFFNPQKEQANDVAVNSQEPQPNATMVQEAVPQETPMEVEDSDKKSEEEGLQAFPPEKLFEYPWPQDQEGAELFMIQEQICEYLEMKSFRRKTMARRAVELEEREFLREKGVVTEVQCDLGLTALRSEEVLEMMSKEYPDHYARYIKVLRERELQKHREYAAANSDKTKMVDLVRKAVQSAAEYNAHLNQERREERRSCMDLQTFTIHYPKSNKPKPEVSTKPGKYPVALLPGQFQDYYKEYTPDELKYLPLNTVLYGPLKELQGGEEVSSESEESSASASSSSEDEGSSSESEEKVEEPEYKPKVKPNATCKVCKKGSSDPNAKDELVHCADCDNSAHPACIELSPDVVNVLRTYPWQCTDCKVCSQCRDPNDEDKMLFCDTCDRGYHTFCVGLKGLPAGKWVCRKCGTCDGCGATHPGEKAQWLCEAGENGKPRILCQSCSKKKR